MRKSTINGHFLYSYVKLPEGTNHIHSPRTSARYFEVELTEHSDPKYNRWLGPLVGATKKDKVRNRKKAGSIMDYPPHNKKGLQEVRMFRTLDLFSRRQLNRFQKNTIPHPKKRVNCGSVSCSEVSEVATDSFCGSSSCVLIEASWELPSWVTVLKNVPSWAFGKSLAP